MILTDYSTLALAHTNEEKEDCEQSLRTEDSITLGSSSPIPDVSFEDYANTIYLALSRFPKGIREDLIALMYRDQEGPSTDLRTQLFETLLDKFRYISKPERLRMRNLKVSNDRQNSFSHDTQIRKLMRYYGSKDNLFITPEQISHDIAELYSKLEDEEERKTALGMLPSLNKFPPWGREALFAAFAKLGFSKTKTAWLLFWRLNKKILRFFVRNEEGKRTAFYWDRPPYFNDYWQQKSVRTFVKYMERRIKEGTNFSKSIDLNDLVNEEYGSGKALLNDFAELQKQEEQEQLRQKEAERENQRSEIYRILNLLKDSKKILETTLEKITHIQPPEWLLEQKPSGKNTVRTQINPEERKSFQNYFKDLMASNLEREWAVEALKHILISKGNMLLVGPGGTAKTSMIRQFLGNLQIEGKSSYAEVQFSQESTSDEVKGPFDPRALLEEGKYTRRYDQGVFDSAFVTFDEIDKARPKLHPTLFTFLADRLDAAASKITHALTQIVVGTANKFVSQLYLSPNILPQEVQPFIDRFDYVVFVPGEMELIKSSIQLSNDIDFQSKLDMKVVEKARSLMTEVEVPLGVKLMANLLFYEMRSKTVAHQKKADEEYTIQLRQSAKPPAPYKSTKIYSPRTQRKLFEKALKAAVVLRYLENPQSSLTADFDDLKALRYFLVMSGPSLESCEYFKKHALDPHEESQYDFVEFENKAFDSILENLIKGYEGPAFKELTSQLNALAEAIETLPSLSATDRILQLAEEMKKLSEKTSKTLVFPKRNHELKPEHILVSEHADELKNAFERATKAYLLKLEPVLERLSHEAASL